MELQREVVQVVDQTRQRSSWPIRRTLAALGTLGGRACPTIQSDYGSGFIARAFAETLGGSRVTHKKIRPHMPTGNRHIDSFNGKLRDELLNGEIFYALREAKAPTERWREHYNRIRPHSSLGYRPPAPEVIAVPAIAGYPSGGPAPAAPTSFPSR